MRPSSTGGLHCSYFSFGPPLLDIEREGLWLCYGHSSQTPPDPGKNLPDARIWGGDHQHFSSALEATVKLHPRPIVEEGKGLLYEAFGKKFWSYLNKFYMQKLTKENNGNHSFSSYLLTKFLGAHSCTSHPQCCSLEC